MVGFGVKGDMDFEKSEDQVLSERGRDAEFSLEKRRRFEWTSKVVHTTGQDEGWDNGWFSSIKVGEKDSIPQLLRNDSVSGDRRTSLQEDLHGTPETSGPEGRR